MMKKRIVLVLLAFFLVGCANVVPEAPQPEAPKSDPVVPEVETSDEKEESEPVVEEEPKEEPKKDESVKMTRNEYIKSTFAAHGFTTPAEDKWIVKEEGPQKIAVIIKEPVSKGKPNISKLIFLEGETNEILFLEINNKIIIKG